MNRGSRRFPLIADDEPVMSPLVKMNLYDNEDLLTTFEAFIKKKHIKAWSKAIMNMKKYHILR